MKITIDAGRVNKREPIYTNAIAEVKYLETHQGHAFPTHQLAEIERFLPQSVANSVETGCGKSTVMFSNISKNHRVFAIDDRNGESSSVNFFMNHPLTKKKNIDINYGPTQKTLPNFNHGVEYDIALIDGAHAYPFAEIDYLSIYPWLKLGTGLLIIDDVTIHTVARLADFLFEDEMFEFIALINWTAIFRRTKSATFPIDGDGWAKQMYNRKRRHNNNDFYIGGKKLDFFTSLRIAGMNLDELVHTHIDQAWLRDKK